MQDIVVLENLPLITKEIISKWFDALDSEYLKELNENLNVFVGKRGVSLRKQLTELISAYESENLVLVLGAGVSVEYGLPSWGTLLQKLLLSSFKKETSGDTDKSLVLAKLFTKIFNPNPLIAARYLRNHFKSDKDRHAFEKAVRSALYEHIKNDFISDFYKEVVQLCVAPGRSPNLNSILTYNYDDILEVHLKNLYIDIPFKSICSVGVHPKPGELPIYHVHGYLPRRGRISTTNLVTLSEDAYHQQYSDTYSWNNIVQINKFRDSVCLFVGLSLTDPNLRRLLDVANTQRGTNKTQHFALRKRYDSTVLEEQLDRLLKNNPEVLDEKSRAKLKLSETVKYLVRVMEQFETQDDLSFGIQTIWVNDYSDIPKIISAVRERRHDVKLSTPNE